MGKCLRPYLYPFSRSLCIYAYGWQTQLSKPTASQWLHADLSNSFLNSAHNVESEDFHDGTAIMEYPPLLGWALLHINIPNVDIRKSVSLGTSAGTFSVKAIR